MLTTTRKQFLHVNCTVLVFSHWHDNVVVLSVCHCCTFWLNDTSYSVNSRNTILQVSPTPTQPPERLKLHISCTMKLVPSEEYIKNILVLSVRLLI